MRGPAHLFRTTAQRIATFLPQEEFAERIGISQNYLSTIEHGKVEIGAEILRRISREFAKSVEWLLMGEG
jgi:transcriptional regulator with XRE-family HTH domain